MKLNIGVLKMPKSEKPNGLTVLQRFVTEEIFKVSAEIAKRSQQTGVKSHTAAFTAVFGKRLAVLDAILLVVNHHQHRHKGLSEKTRLNLIQAAETSLWSSSLSADGEEVSRYVPPMMEEDKMRELFRLIRAA
ncbi:MAG TPA: hypothetical protein VHD55_03665 [Candidatus Paceibacterota bacterium]|nr:hypothetical protein [Candidatus Paceibacterota bacterium]